jgi:hypothetical protein
MRLTTHLHLVQSIRMNEDIPPLPMCACKACRMTAVLLPVRAVLVEWDGKKWHTTFYFFTGLSSAHWRGLLNIA